MDAALERRVSVATCWATTRIAVLDSAERYEDSYALTQEFREWILCIGEHPEMLEDSVMSLKQCLQASTLARTPPQTPLKSKETTIAEF